MSDQIRQISERIKELREVSGVTVESLAKDLGIAPEAYREYESGDADIPVSLLYEIAGKFNVELTEILTGDHPRLHTYSLVRKGKGVAVKRTQSYDYQSLAYNFAHKRVEPLLVTVQPGANEGPGEMNAHPGQEFDYVISGRLGVTVGESELELGEGDCIYFDSHHPHSMKALDSEPAQFVAIIL